MSKPAEQEDAFTAALALKRATATRLASSWLADSLSSFPDTPDSDDDLTSTGPLFAPAPPTLGLGAPVPKEFLGNDLSAKVEQERLRRRLLGPLMKKKKDGEEGVVRKKEVVVEDEEDEGRSGLGRAKKSGKRKVVEEVEDDVEMEEAVEKPEVVKKVVKKVVVDSDEEDRKGSKPKFANSFDAYKSQKKKKKRKRADDEEDTPATAPLDAAPSTESAERPDGEQPAPETTTQPPNPETPPSTLTSTAQERRRRKRERQKNKTKSETSEAL